MSRYLHAFDLAVSAAGYNAFHELIAFGVPALFVPMARNTDDQFARAGWAAAEGAGLAVDGAADAALGTRIEELCEPERAAELRRECGRAFPGNGAGRAALLVAEMAAGSSRAPSVRERGRLNRWLRLSSLPVGPTLPLVLALGGRDLLHHPERRAPRLVVLAIGVPDAELPERVVEAIGGMERARVLVLTDSLAFAELRRLGVGFEHLPAPSADHRGGEVARLRERAAVLLRGRKPLRAISIGELGPEVLGLPAQEVR